MAEAANTKNGASKGEDLASRRTYSEERVGKLRRSSSLEAKHPLAYKSLPIGMTTHELSCMFQGNALPAHHQGVSASAFTLPADGLGRPPGVEMTSDRGPEMEGRLWKWANYLQGHQERYFVLRGTTLSYYRDREEIDSVCRGSVHLHNARITRLDKLSIQITTPTQTNYLKAEDETSCKRWLTALQMAMHYKDPTNNPPQEYVEDDAESSSEEEEKDDPNIDTYLSTLNQRIEAIKAYHDVVIRETAVMQAAFTHVESKVLNSSPAIRQVHKQGANLYTYVAGGLVSACKEYLDDAVQTAGVLTQALKHERRRREKLELTLAQLARQHHNLENQAEHIIRNQEDGYEGNALEDSEDEFFDATPEGVEVMRVATGVPEGARAEKATQQTRRERKRDEQKARSETVLLDTKDVAILPKRTYRNSIPYRQNVRINFWSVLKNFIGRDLTKIPMPVAFNEPLSLLQRLSEDLEYSDILNRAAKCRTSQERLCHVAAFTVSAYSSVVSRTQKPFNPLLGETFELDMSQDPRYGWRSIAEQVSHHPPIAAMHTDNSQWELQQQFSMDSKFRGKYMQIVPTGISTLHFKSTGERYTWTKVTTTVHNIIVGKLWIDNHGEMAITDHTTGDVCRLEYVPYSYFSRETPRTVRGTVEDRTGKVHFVLEGTWDQQIAYYPVGRPDQSVVPWKMSPLPPDHTHMYGFSYFACMLNDPSAIYGTSPTDSRRRPDQRELEHQRYEEADSEKHRLEEKQRAARRQREEGGKVWAPRWFKESVDADTDHPIHTFTGAYWEAKERQKWDACPDIY